MPTLNDLQLSSWETLTGNTGQLNDLLVEYLQAIAGITSNNPNDLWYKVLTDLGYTGTVQDMQLEYWADITGKTGTWNDLYYEWLLDTGGAFGPNVNIVLATGGSCEYLPPTTTDCTAVGTYTANDSGFTNPANTWLWTIEPPVIGVDLTDATLQTCTVTTPTADANLDFNLKVVATDSVSTDTANRTTAYTQAHTDANVAPVYTGPNIANRDYAVNVLITPVDTFNLYTGTNLVFTLEGTWPTGLVIDSASGQITGTPTGAEQPYPNLFVRVTNSKGIADSTQFQITLVSSVVAPLFDNGPVPDQIWQTDIAIAQFPIGQYFITGSFPRTYTIESGALPTGLTMNTAGQINGTPTVEGETGSIVIRCTNSAGFALTNDWGWTSWEAIVASTVPDQSFPLDELYTHDYSQYFTGTITSWALGGVWPAGFAIDGNGVVTGTATVDQEAFPNLFITADNIYEAPVSTTTFNGITEPAVTDPVFYALTPDETTYEMLGVRIGTGGLTTTHTSDLYAPDFEGVYRGFGANEPVWSGGYVAFNRLTYSNDLSQATAWTITGNLETPTFDQVGITGEPNTATLLDSQDITGNPSIEQAVTGAAVSIAQTRIVWIKQDSDVSRFPLVQVFGTGINLAYQLNTMTGDLFEVINPGWTVTATLVNGWWRMILSGSAFPAIPIIIYPAAASTWGGSEVTATGSIVVGNVETYLSTDNYSVPSALNWPIPVYSGATPILHTYAVDDAGTPLAEVPYLQYYPAAENELLYSNNLANVAWSTTGGTRSFDQIGLTGEPNTATLVNDNTGSSSPYTFQEIVTPADALTRTSVIYIAKDTDQTRFPEFWIANKSSSATVYVALQINTETGASAERAALGVTDWEVIDDGLWWKILVSLTNDNTGTAHHTRLIPAFTNTLGGAAEVSVLGSIIVGNVEVYL